jgi:erythromycin esterase-like protein
MANQDDAALAHAVRAAARPLRGTPEDFDPMLELVADARCVLIGEATHGTHEFYHLRAELTKRKSWCGPTTRTLAMHGLPR